MNYTTLRLTMKKPNLFRFSCTLAKGIKECFWGK